MLYCAPSNHERSPDKSKCKRDRIFLPQITVQSDLLHVPREVLGPAIFPMDTQRLGSDLVDEMLDWYDWIRIVHDRDEIHSTEHVLRHLQFKSIHYCTLMLLLAERAFDFVRSRGDALCFWWDHNHELI